MVLYIYKYFVLEALLTKKTYCLPYTVKKVGDFPVPSRNVTITKLILADNNLINPGQGEFG